MAKYFYTNIDLKGNQLISGVIHNATTAPTGGVAGQVYYNTDDKLMYQHNGTEWVVVGGSVANLATDVKKVVTGSSTSNGTATLATTDLKDMKVGVGLTNLTNVTADTTVSGEFQAIDTALQDVKTTYVKAGSTYTSGDILVAGASGGIKDASTTGYSIETTLDPTHSTKIPTSEAVATYIGSLAGGINYKGTIGASPATVQSLPTTGVKVGDAYAVTTAGTYTPLTEPSAVGDLIICNSVNGGTITWTNVPINFTVEDKQLRNFAPASGAQTIATIDGKDITMSLQAITTGTSGSGNVVTGVSADANNKLTIAKGNALTTVNPASAGTGVVTSVVKNSNNTTIDVTYTDLTVAAPTGIQYVTSVSQAADGKVTVSGTNFDGTVPTNNPSTSNAPTTKAVKDYVDGKIDGLDDYFEKKFTDGSHDVVTIGSYTPASGEIATQKVEFFDGTQTNGALGTSAVTDTLYISKAVTAANPIITNDDLSGITGAMVYKGVVDGTHALPTTNITAGWTYVVAASGTYAGQACEVGDMIIAKETKASGVTNSDWNVINGENQVSNKGITVQAGAGLQTVATVDGTDITVGVKVVGGNATIASKSGNVVTIKTGVTQSGTTGTIGNATGTDIVLDDVAVTGAANELTVTSATYGGDTATINAQTALNNLATAITDSNITIDGHKGAITTGDGITDVAADGGSFGIQIDSTNANGLSVGASGLAMAKATGSTFGTVEVTAGNGLTLTNGVVAYAHNTSAITVASKNTSTNVIMINGTLTPDASDAITTSNAITLAAVAATGAANELTVTSGTYGGSTATTNAQTALNNLASSAVLVYKSGALTFSNNTATITISGADLQNSAITEIRDSSHNVVECDVVYTNATTITVTANGNPTGLYAIVHYKKA